MAAARGCAVRTASQLWKRMHQSPAAEAAAVQPGFRQMSTSEPIVNKKLVDKVAIITGASGMIGSTTSKLFAAHGAQVIMADIADEVGQKKASEIGPTAHYRHCDVTKEEDVEAAVGFALEKFGKLDIMFNNAGVVTPIDTFEDLDLNEYDKHHSILVRGVVAGIKHAARAMIPKKRGVILNTGSTAAVFTSSAMPLSYNICKSTFPGLTKVAAYHLGKHGIRVNAISPTGIFNDAMVTKFLISCGCEFTSEEAEAAFVKYSDLWGKRITEDDVANGSLFLCSEDSGYVTGHNLMVDGGWCNSKEFGLLDELRAKKK